MKIQAKVTFRQYLKLLYRLTYEKPMMKFLIFVAIVIVVWIAVYYLDLFALPEPIIYQYITLILIVVVQPFVIFTTIRKNYYSSSHLREMLDMELTPKQIKIKGESFYMEILWTNIYKVVEKQNWFLVYQNNLSAIIIPKKDLSEAEKHTIREILKSANTVK